MKHILKQFMRFLVIIMIIGYLGCASVPREVVKLSDTVGKDLNAVYVSYKDLAETYFDSLRKQVNDFVDNKWVPVYLKNFIQETDLKNKITTFTPDQVLIYLQKWVAVATKEIKKKRDSLLNPIDEDEKKLLAAVDEAFGQLNYANATITANLQSIWKVKDLEDKALSALHLKDLRDKMADTMVTSSEKLKDAINVLKEASGMIDMVDKDTKDLEEKSKELFKKKKDNGGTK